MKKGTAITCLFLDVDGVLLANRTFNLFRPRRSLGL
jgi:hypothetical protein